MDKRCGGFDRTADLPDVSARATRLELSGEFGHSADNRRNSVRNRENCVSLQGISHFFYANFVVDAFFVLPLQFGNRTLSIDLRRRGVCMHRMALKQTRDNNQ